MTTTGNNTGSPTIVVLGGSGMLGHKMFQRLSAKTPSVYCLMQQSPSAAPFARIPLLQSEKVIGGINAMDFPKLKSVLTELRPDVIINCIGVIKQRETAASYIPTITLNSLLPHLLAETVAEWGGRLIHFSTDCVFSGRKGMYSESDFSDAEDLYGRTKFLGETPEDNAITLRTSIIGRELTNHRSLLDWFLGNDGGTVKGYQKAMYSGVTTNQLTDVVWDMVLKHPELHGIYQVVSAPISKYELLVLLRDAYGLTITIEAVDGENVDRTMDGTKFKEATGYVCPSWRQLVQDLANDPTPYREWLGS